MYRMYLACSCIFLPPVTLPAISLALLQCPSRCSLRPGDPGEKLLLHPLGHLYSTVQIPVHSLFQDLVPPLRYPSPLVSYPKARALLVDILYLSQTPPNPCLTRGILQTPLRYPGSNPVSFPPAIQQSPNAPARLGQYIFLSASFPLMLPKAF